MSEPRASSLYVEGIVVFGIFMAWAICFDRIVWTVERWVQ